MKKILNNKNVLREASVLLISSLIVLSSTTAATTISVSSPSVDSRKDGPYDRGFSVILLEEGFEDGVMPPPGGWEVVDYNDQGYNWGIVDDPVYSGDYAAMVPRCSSSMQDERLISPEIDLTGYSEVTLVFWVYSMTFGSDWTVELIIKGDGFADVIWDMVDDEDWQSYEWREKTFDLSGYIEEDIRITWRYEGIRGWDFGLDDIFVSGEPVEYAELEIGEVTGGGKLFSGGVVSAEVKNVGDGNATEVNWNISVNGGLLGLINVTDSGTIAKLDAHSMETVQTSTPIYGFGRINITVTATAADIEPAIKTVDGFIIIFYIIIASDDAIF
jgi:hypothetical protein